MKHALDVAIALDSMAHNARLGLHYLVPVSSLSLSLGYHAILSIKICYLVRRPFFRVGFIAPVFRAA